MASHSSILAWRIPWTEEPEGTDHGVRVTEQPKNAGHLPAWRCEGGNSGWGREKGCLPKEQPPR